MRPGAFVYYRYTQGAAKGHHDFNLERMETLSECLSLRKTPGTDRAGEFLSQAYFVRRAVRIRLCRQSRSRAVVDHIRAEIIRVLVWQARPRDLARSRIPHLRNIDA